MNLQSNALKFTRENGQIKIIAEYIPARGKPVWGSRKSQFFNLLSSESNDEEKNSDSESSDNAFEDERDPQLIRNPDDEFDKVVFTVIDTGIGIKKKDKLKLFKLFGTL